MKLVQLEVVAGSVEEQQQAYRARHYEKYKRRSLAKQGYTPELVDVLLQLQKHLCAVCSRKLEGFRYHVCCDHDHTNGQPRGLLCNPCNTAVGIYENEQRPVGLRIPIYEKYLTSSPVKTTLTHKI